MDLARRGLLGEAGETRGASSRGATRTGSTHASSREHEVLNRRSPLGGYLADRMRARHPLGRVRFAFVPALIPIPLALSMLAIGDTTLTYAIYLPLGIVSSMWLGAGASTIQDLVLPRMRGIASAFYLLIITFIGFAMGPFTVGLLSDAFGLPTALRLCLLSNLLAAAFLLAGMRHLERDEERMLGRAEASGEVIKRTAIAG